MYSVIKRRAYENNIDYYSGVIFLAQLAQAVITLNEFGCNHLGDIILKQILATQKKGIPDDNAIVAFMKQLQASYTACGGVASWLEADEGKELLNLMADINKHVSSTQEYHRAIAYFRVMANADTLGEVKQKGYNMAAHYLQTKCLLRFPSLNNTTPSQDPFNFYYSNVSIPDDQWLNTYKYFCAGMMYNAYMNQYVQELKSDIWLVSKHIDEQ